MSESVYNYSQYNRTYRETARESGRREIRGMLKDSDTSAMYEELIANVPKKQIGKVLSAMVKLSHRARENGELVINKDGTVIINEKVDDSSVNSGKD